VQCIAVHIGLRTRVDMRNAIQSVEYKIVFTAVLYRVADCSVIKCT
jgi:hypothetical protein